MTVVAKIGTSSITDDHGNIDPAAVAKFCHEVAQLRRNGTRVVVVTSGAISAGLPVVGLHGPQRPRDAVTLQAVSAIGQSRLMQVYNEAFGELGIVSGQVLLAPLDFGIRSQYLHARGTLERLLELDVVPVVNENDAIADDEIRFGDNDRLAALVAHLVGAHVLVLLTDTAGVLTADPRFDETASLIEEIVEIDQQLEAVAGRSGSDRGSGGMASKLAAAKIASWSGVTAVIADAGRDGVLEAAAAGEAGVGTVVRPATQRMSARKLWIAFAVAPSGTIEIDDGARACAGRASAVAAGGRGDRRARLVRGRRCRRDRRPRRRGVRQGYGPGRLDRARRSTRSPQRRPPRRRRPLRRPPRRPRGRCPSWWRSRRRPRERAPRPARWRWPPPASVSSPSCERISSSRVLASMFSACCSTSIILDSTVAPSSSACPLRLGVAPLDLVADLVERRHVLADGLLQAAHRLVHLLLHLGLIELAQQLLALGQLLLEGHRVLADRGLGLVGGLGGLELELLEILDLTLDGDEPVGEGLGGVGVFGGLGRIARLLGLVGHQHGLAGVGVELLVLLHRPVEPHLGLLLVGDDRWPPAP